MKTKTLSVLLLLALAFGALTPVRAAKAAEKASESKGVSPAGMLNSDGTLKLDGSFSGALDVSGYSVEIDSERGPIFSAEGSGEANPEALGINQWGSLGGGGTVFNNGSVGAVAVYGNIVYVGGSFRNANSIPEADFVAKWNGTTWSALGSNGSGDGSIKDDGVWTDVYALAVDATGNLYVAGNFWDVNSNGIVLTAADCIAKWDGTYWYSLGNDGASNGSLAGEIYDIEISGTNLYAVGYFSDVNNKGSVLNAADYIARWDMSLGNWHALGGDATGDGSLKEEAYAVAVSGTNVYVGGMFTNVMNNGVTLTAADYIAKWDGTNWSALGGTDLNAGALNNAVYALAVDGSGNVYAGGEFTDVRIGMFTLLTADYIAKWNGSSWSALGNNGAGDGSLQNTVNEIVVNAAGDVYAAGNFFDVNNGGNVLGAADYIAKWNGSAWSGVGDDGSGNGALKIKYGMYGLAVSGTKLYATGSFSSVNNHGALVLQAAGLAKWDGSNWSALGTGTNGSLNAYVSAITIDGTNVYVGGDFTDVMDQGVMITEADYIAKWNGSHWSALGSNGSGNGSLNSVVREILVDGADIYVHGGFTDVNNNGTVLPAADYLAKWDGSAWSALGSGPGGVGAITDAIDKMTMRGNSLYIAGWFTNAAGIPEADYVARWNGSAWSALGNDGAGNGSLTISANALAFIGNDLYVSGQFTNVNNHGNVLGAADYLAKWDGTNWSALGSNGAGDGAISNIVGQIVVNGSNVYVGGRFTNVNNNGTVLTAADNIALWDGKNWSALGSGANGEGAIQSEIYTIAVSDKTLYAGGVFFDVKNGGTLLPEGDFIAAFGVAPQKSTLSSTAAQDGWILETGENTNKGGTMNGGATTLRLGDDAAKKQYRAALSFSTQALPDNAVITKVTLRVKSQGIIGGGNPVTMFQGFMADVKKGSFGTSALQAADFQTAAGKSVGPVKPALTAGWYSLNLTSAAAQINKLATGGGLTQIRLRFKLDDNNNAAANTLSLFSGNAPAASRPKLIIEYYVP